MRGAVEQVPEALQGPGVPDLLLEKCVRRQLEELLLRLYEEIPLPVVTGNDTVVVEVGQGCGVGQVDIDDGEGPGADHEFQYTVRCIAQVSAVRAGQLGLLDERPLQRAE